MVQLSEVNLPCRQGSSAQKSLGRGFSSAISILPAPDGGCGVLWCVWAQHDLYAFLPLSSASLFFLLGFPKPLPDFPQLSWTLSRFQESFQILRFLSLLGRSGCSDRPQIPSPLPPNVCLFTRLLAVWSLNRICPPVSLFIYFYV